MPTTTPTANAVSGIRALTDISWMARRSATYADQPDPTPVNEAIWLLHRLAARHHLTVGHPDQTANRDYPADGNITENPSFFTDGAPTDFAPSEEREHELQAMSQDAAVQWMVTILHPLAHTYADGASTYAPGMCNDATRVLRAAGFDLSATEALGKSVWVTDGMGDSFLRLNSTEIAERNAARTNTTVRTGF